MTLNPRSLMAPPRFPPVADRFREEAQAHCLPLTLPHGSPLPVFTGRGIRCKDAATCYSTVSPRTLPRGNAMPAFGDYQNEIYFKGLHGVKPKLPVNFSLLEQKARAAL